MDFWFYIKMEKWKDVTIEGYHKNQKDRKPLYSFSIFLSFWFCLLCVYLVNQKDRKSIKWKICKMVFRFSYTENALQPLIIKTSAIVLTVENHMYN